MGHMIGTLKGVERFTSSTVGWICSVQSNSIKACLFMMCAQFYAKAQQDYFECESQVLENYSQILYRVAQGSSRNDNGW